MKKSWLVLLSLLIGCASTQTPPPVQTTGLSAVADPQDVWLPRPVALRIYPATRFVREAGQPLLEVRVELFDAMGDPIKASGRARVELFASRSRTEPDPGRRLYVWDVELLSVADHQRYYDPVIRGYLFRLQMDELEAARRPTVLRVSFKPVRGQPMQAQTMMIPPEQGGPPQ